jgi:hypothetical protein
MKPDGCAGAGNGCHLFVSISLGRFSQPMVNGPLKFAAWQNWRRPNREGKCENRFRCPRERASRGCDWSQRTRRGHLNAAQRIRRKFTYQF